MPAAGVPLMVAQRPLHLCGMPIALARASQDHVDSMPAAAEQAAAGQFEHRTTPAPEASPAGQCSPHWRVSVAARADDES